MENTENYMPQKDDYVTIEEWIDSNDKSYIRSVFKVLGVDGDLVCCKHLERSVIPTTILSTKQVRFRKLSYAFAQLIMDNQKW